MSVFVLWLQVVLDPLRLLRRLGVVPAVHGAHQIAGDAADTLKALRRKGYLLGKYGATPDLDIEEV